MRFVWILFLALVSACSTPAPSTLDSVVALNLDTIDGSLPTYYSNSYTARAETTLNLLHNSIAFYRDHFKVDPSVALAVLEATDWREITRIPYGMPFVSGPPYIVCIPATSDHALAKTITTAIQGSELTARYEITPQEMTRLFVSLIGFHELGHMVAKTYGIRVPNRWIDEFTATYLAYVYLDQNAPRERDIWTDVANILAKKLNHPHNLLKAFEALYVNVGMENYAWYQAVFLQGVKTVYEEHGMEFLKTLKDHQWPPTSPSEYVNQLDQLAPGILSWAQTHALQTQ